MRAGLSSHDGTLYAAPFYGESSMVMYRKDLADAAGVSVRDNDSAGQMSKALLWQCMILIMGFMVHVYAVSQVGAITGAFITTVANSFGARWFDENMKPSWIQLLGMKR